MRTLFRFELVLALAASAMVVWLTFTPRCLLACPMFVEPPDPLLELSRFVPIGLLAIGWVWIALLVRGARRQK